MKPRLRKKLNKKAKNLLIEIGEATEDDFSLENGQWVQWFRCGGYGEDWDYQEIYTRLYELAICSLTVFSEDGCNYWQSRKIRNAKDVFDLVRRDRT